MSTSPDEVLTPEAVQQAVEDLPGKPVTANGREIGRVRSASVDPEVERGAVLSEDQMYRYSLWRIFDRSKGSVLFIGLNPSTADAKEDDPTIRRCMRFAKDWGYGGMLMANLYAFRATKFAGVDTEDPVGPDNDEWLKRMAAKAKGIIVCWGSNQHPLPDRYKQVLQLLEGHHVWCLGVTKELHPRHPLYVPAKTMPAPWPPAYDADTKCPPLTDQQFQMMCECLWAKQ